MKKYTIAFIALSISISVLADNELKWKSAYERRLVLIQENYNLMVDNCVADRFKSKIYIEKAIEKLKISEEDFTNFFIDDCVKDIEQGKFEVSKANEADLVPQNDLDPKVLPTDELTRKISSNQKEIEELRLSIQAIEPRWVLTKPMRSCQETCQEIEMNESNALDLSFEGCRLSTDTSFKAHLKSLAKGSRSDRLIELLPYYYASLDKLLVEEMGLTKDSAKYEETENFLRTNFVCYTFSNSGSVDNSALFALKEAARNLSNSSWLVKSCYCSYRKDFINYKSLTKEPLPSL